MNLSAWTAVVVGLAVAGCGGKAFTADYFGDGGGPGGDDAGGDVATADGQVTGDDQGGDAGAAAPGDADAGAVDDAPSGDGHTCDVALWCVWGGGLDFDPCTPGSAAFSCGGRSCLEAGACAPGGPCMSANGQPGTVGSCL